MTTAIPAESYDAVIATPVPRVKVGLRFAGERLVGVDFLGGEAKPQLPKSSAQRRMVKQLQHYFVDPAADLDMALQIEGTAFQQRVWKAMRQIPPGKTLTYGELARRLGSSARAVGSACRTNHLPLVIPCHRVVAKSGLGGFMGQTRGAGLTLKQWLLEHEQRVNDG